MMYFFSPVASQFEKQDVTGKGGGYFHQDRDQWLLWTFGFHAMLEISSMASQEGIDSVEF
jgi:hypothetical protein